jgi:ADP-heptose:LPS heptosyltransferase
VVYDKKASLWRKLKFILELRKVSYDWVVDLRNTAIPFLVSCKNRTPLFRKFTKVNMRERHLELLSLIKKKEFLFPGEAWSGTRTTPFCFFNEVDDELALRTLEFDKITDKGKWIVVAAGAASERKRWPAQHFTAMIRALHEKTGKKVLMVGLLNERPVADSIAATLPGVVSVFCGDLTISETAALISRASLLISNDSANMHLGFELGVPTVGIFGPTDHEKYGHGGPKFRVAREDASDCPCESYKLPCAERSCFHGLKPEKVIGLSLELLNASPSA